MSLDNTFKSAGKAVVVDKDRNRVKLLKGGVLSVINEKSEIIAWVCHQHNFLEWYSFSLIGSAFVRVHHQQKFVSFWMELRGDAVSEKGYFRRSWLLTIAARFGDKSVKLCLKFWLSSTFIIF